MDIENLKRLAKDAQTAAQADWQTRAAFIDAITPETALELVYGIEFLRTELAKQQALTVAALQAAESAQRRAARDLAASQARRGFYAALPVPDDAELKSVAEQIMRGMRTIALRDARRDFAVRVLRDWLAAAPKPEDE